MKTGFKEFLKDSIKNLQGDQDSFKNHSFKTQARKLLKADAAERKAKRKAVKAARKRAR